MRELTGNVFVNRTLAKRDSNISAIRNFTSPNFMDYLGESGTPSPNKFYLKVLDTTTPGTVFRYNKSDTINKNGTAPITYGAVGGQISLNIEDVEELYSGIRLACEQYGVDIVGGDTTSSLTGLAISITATGTASGSAFFMGYKKIFSAVLRMNSNAHTVPALIFSQPQSADRSRFPPGTAISPRCTRWQAASR